VDGPRTYSGTRWAPRYFAAQSLAFLAWWAALLLVPSWRDPFRPAAAHDLDLLAFALPDLAVAVPLGLVAAATFARAPGWCRATAWAAAGAVAYSAAYVLAWAVLRDGGWLAVAPMVPAATLSVFFALDLSADALPVFRRARPRSAAGNLAVTGLYIALFWSVFLGVIPWCIAFVERKLGVPALAFPLQRAVAAVLFAAASAVALWSGATMARRGGGTPLPMDATTLLVVSGPYRLVRNPMVATGLLQAAAVGLWLGSWTTLAYAVAGGVLWDQFVRPAEERDLAVLFGADYDAYRARVKCWVPKFR
jgi:protein-S-isoprenylcysteine O-methyltransferase Ste14